jgi:hypothetical protein
VALINIIDFNNIKEIRYIILATKKIFYKTIKTETEL